MNEFNHFLEKGVTGNVPSPFGEGIRDEASRTVPCSGQRRRMRLQIIFSSFADVGDEASHNIPAPSEKTSRMRLR